MADENKADNPLITWQKEMIAEQLKRLDDQTLLQQWQHQQTVRDVPAGVIGYWKKELEHRNVITGEYVARLDHADARAVMVAMQDDHRRWVWDSRQRVYTTLMKDRPRRPNDRGVIDYLVERARKM